jgi:hypothetical protein
MGNDVTSPRTYLLTDDGLGRNFHFYLIVKHAKATLLNTSGLDSFPIKSIVAYPWR